MTVEDLGILQDWWDGAKSASGIYAIVGHSHTYIGKSKNVEARVQAHAQAIFGSRSSSLLPGGQAILKEQASRPLRVLLLERCANERLDERENYWIDLLIKLGVPLANRAPGGGTAGPGSISMNEWVEKQGG